MPGHRWRRALLPMLVVVPMLLLATAGCGTGGVGSAPAGASAAASVTMPAPDVASAAGVPSPGRPATAAPQAASAGSLPAGVPVPPAATSQLVTVRAPSASGTTATVDTWQRAASGAGWLHVLGPVSAQVGKDGVGVASEQVSRTPAGTFALTESFGRAADPGAHLPYRHVDDNDWWVSDVASPLYNTHQRCAPGSCPFNESVSENLGRSGASYDYAVVIDYNTAPVNAGAGSAFFLHVDAGVRSVGCVAMSRSAVLDVLRWLDPARHPVITIRAG